MKKRIISMVLLAVMLFVVGINVFANESYSYTATGYGEAPMYILDNDGCAVITVKKFNDGPTNIVVHNADSKKFVVTIVDPNGKDVVRGKVCTAFGQAVSTKGYYKVYVRNYDNSQMYKGFEAWYKDID